MSPGFCPACGHPLPAGVKFCTSCGTPVAPAPPPPACPPREEVCGIVPFVEYTRGLTSSDSGTLIVTDRRIIFARRPPAAEPLMKAEREKIRAELESAQDAGTGYSDERQFYYGRDWIHGPWQGYAAMDPGEIVAESPGNFFLLFGEISAATFINAKGTSRTDSLDLSAPGKNYEFILQFSLGPAALALLREYLGDRATDRMAVWGTTDRIVTLLGGKRR